MHDFIGLECVNLRDRKTTHERCCGSQEPTHDVDDVLPLPRCNTCLIEQVKTSLDNSSQLSIQRLTPFFGPLRAARLTSADVTRYKTQRQGEGVANATINRELAALKRALSLALKAERIQRAPYIEMLQEDNVRKGFFEREQFEAIRE